MFNGSLAVMAKSIESQMTCTCPTIANFKRPTWTLELDPSLVLEHWSLAFLSLTASQRGGR
jgi:hypothetical protein